MVEINEIEEIEEDTTDAFIEHQNEEIWEKADFDFENDDEDLDDLNKDKDEDEDLLYEDYLSNCPCDNSGICAGISCSAYFTCN